MRSPSSSVLRSILSSWPSRSQSIRHHLYFSPRRDLSSIASSASLPLEAADSEIHTLIEEEKSRQALRIDLTASHNFTTLAVTEALGSAPLTGKCCEKIRGGHHGAEEIIDDEIEELCVSRALQAFRLDPATWGVNVRPYSGSQAIIAASNALLGPNDRIMFLELSSGGHISHGYFFYCTYPCTNNSCKNDKVFSVTSTYFRSLPYEVNGDTGLIDFDELERKAMIFRPNLILCGGYFYPRDWDYPRFREVANKCGALLLCDMSSINGLVAAQEASNPFEYCDVVTTSTNYSLGGPSSGMIFFRKDGKPSVEGGLMVGGSDPPISDNIKTRLVSGFDGRINNSTSPFLQDSPYIHQIGSLAVALKQVMSPAFKEYAKQVKANANAIGNYFKSKGYSIVTSGTDNHLVLLDFRCGNPRGWLIEMVCNLCHISINKCALIGNLIPIGGGKCFWEPSSSGWIYKHPGGFTPTGLCICTNAMTSRGLVEEDFEKIGDLLHQAIIIARKIPHDFITTSSPDFDEYFVRKDLEDLKQAVMKFAKTLA